MMATSRLDMFFNILANQGWHTEKRRTGPLQFDNEMRQRYPNLPEDYTRFLEQISLCTNADETVWFLMEEDYAGKSDPAFSWNEFEIMSLDASEEDEDLVRTIKRFWQEHIPIMFSLVSGYAFLAIDVSKESYGKIVIGREPEFEDVSEVCSSFEQLLDILEASVENKNSSPLNGFI